MVRIEGRNGNLWPERADAKAVGPADAIPYPEQSETRGDSQKNPDEAKPSKLNIRLTQAAGFVEGAPACDRNVAAALGFRAADRVSHQALTLVFSIASREVITLSTMPKSLASSAVMKWSRSSVRSIVS